MIGINWSSCHDSKIIRKIIDSESIDFCEILIDNFFHLDLYEIKSFLSGKKVTFHIMNSRYLEKEIKDLAIYADKIKKAADILNPLYISDHLGRFSHNNRLFPKMLEINYGVNKEIICDKLLAWKNLLGSIVYIENNASFFSSCVKPSEFFDYLLSETGCGLLFDFSNAIVSEKNKVAEKEDWINMAINTSHFHVGSYRKSSYYDAYLDTHDGLVCNDTLLFMEDVFVQSKNLNESTFVIERDANLDITQWKKDIEKVRSLINDHDK